MSRDIRASRSHSRDNKGYSHDGDEFEVEYDSRYDRKMRDAHKGGGCCSFYKFVLFLLFLGGALAVLFGFIDIEEVRNFFSNTVDNATGGGGGDDNSQAVPFMRCPANGECCNGLESNCDLKFNELMYATVHNANHADLFAKNHEAPLEEALEAGYRGLMLDVCMCDNKLEFCHAVCGVGTRDPTEVFENINSFLNSNPSELIVINFEISANKPSPTDIWDLLSTTNLRKKVYNHDHAAGWPTMRELISTEKQVVLFEHNFDDCSQGGNGCAARIEPFFSYAVETPWDFEDVGQLENTAVSCAEDRGSGSLKNFYGVNGFITATFGPSKSAANTVNQRAFIENHIKACEKLTKHEVNFYNIDFWQRGDLLEVTQEINIQRGKRRRRSRYLRWII